MEASRHSGYGVEHILFRPLGYLDPTPGRSMDRELWVSYGLCTIRAGRKLFLQSATQVSDQTAYDALLVAFRLSIERQGSGADLR